MSCFAFDGFWPSYLFTYLLTYTVWLYVASKQALYSAMDESLLGCPHAFFFFARLSDLLVVANSSLNVFVYCCFSQHFCQFMRGLTSWCRRAAFDDSLDSRQETISGAVAGPRPPRSEFQMYELVARGDSVPLPAADTECVLVKQAAESDCENETQ